MNRAERRKHMSELKKDHPITKLRSVVKTIAAAFTGDIIVINATQKNGRRHFITASNVPRNAGDKLLAEYVNGHMSCPKYTRAGVHYCQRCQTQWDTPDYLPANCITRQFPNG